MFDSGLLLERLQCVLTALVRIPRRCADISQASDFLKSEAGLERIPPLIETVKAMIEDIEHGVA